MGPLGVLDDERIDALRRHQMTTNTISSACGADSAEDHDDDRESDQDPDYPREAFEGVKLAAIYECILCAAVQPSTKSGCDGSSACSPEYPSNEQEDAMG